VRIAVSAAGNTLESRVDPRFGRCAWIIIADPETGELEACENPGQNAAHGAGIAAAQLVAEKGAACLITGHCGPKAWKALEAARIPVVADADGRTVREAIHAFKSGKLQTLGGPNNPGGAQ